MRKISVIGFGKIGQAVVANILQHGIQVTAVDSNPKFEKIFLQNRFETTEPGLSEILIKSFNQKKLIITSQYSKIKESDAVIVCIPLLVDNQKEILKKPFLNCFQNLAPYLSKKCLLVIETTMPVGFSRNTVLPLIEKNSKKHGTDFYLIHSPERIKSGTMLEQLLKTPKVIGGIDKAAAQRGKEIYCRFFDEQLIKVVDSIEVAEMIKLAGMAYRDINIAVANQLAMFSDKATINFEEVINYANTDGEVFLLTPGIGVGGHCTPVYPYFLIENFRKKGMNFSLASEARKINDNMAAYSVQLVNKKVMTKKALILGLGFRPDIKEDTFSTSYLLHEELIRKKFKVHIHDPYFSLEEMKKKGFSPIHDIYSSQAEVVFLVTNHTCYQNTDWKKLKKNGCEFFVDGRNAFSGNRIESAGIKYFGIGK